MREVWLVPFVNPDGYVANQATKSCDDEIIRHWYRMLCDALYVCAACHRNLRSCILQWQGLRNKARLGPTHSIYRWKHDETGLWLTIQTQQDSSLFSSATDWCWTQRFRLRQAFWRTWISQSTHWRRYVWHFLQEYHARPPSQNMYKFLQTCRTLSSMRIDANRCWQVIRKNLRPTCRSAVNGGVDINRTVQAAWAFESYGQEL